MATTDDVRWQIGLDDDAWENLPVRSGPAGIDGRSPRHRRAWRGVALPLLLLLAAVAFLWEGGAGEPVTAFGVRAVPALSADRLAAQERAVILTEHLRIHARGTDVATVQAIAPALEALYAQVFAALGLALEAETGAPDGRLLVVLEDENRVAWQPDSGWVILSSPGYLAAGGPWNASDLLRQGWALALIDQAIGKAKDEYQTPVSWLPILKGAQLWLLWDSGGPLAESQRQIVAWLYTEDRTRMPDPAADELCRVYALWERSPLDYSVPIGCTPTHNAIRSSPVLAGDLSSLGLPSDPSSPEVQSRSVTNQARNVTLAVVLQYAAAAHGRQVVPALLAALKEHDSWQTLIPAVFDVAAEEFEAGWQEWLAEEYGL